MNQRSQVKELTFVNQKGYVCFVECFDNFIFLTKLNYFANKTRVVCDICRKRVYVMKTKQVVVYRYVYNGK